MGFYFLKYSILLQDKKKCVLILGLDNYLYKLLLNEVILTAPSKQQQQDMGFKVETLIIKQYYRFYFAYKNLKFQVWDLEGQNVIRYQSKHISVDYIGDLIIQTQMVLYMRLILLMKGRLKTSQEELITLLQEEELKKCSIIDLGKQTSFNLVCKELSETEIYEFLKLEEEKSRSWTLIKCSALTGLGLSEGMEWMANAMKK